MRTIEDNPSLKKTKFSMIRTENDTHLHAVQKNSSNTTSTITHSANTRQFPYTTKHKVYTHSPHPSLYAYYTIPHNEFSWKLQIFILTHEYFGSMNILVPLPRLTCGTLHMHLDQVTRGHLWRTEWINVNSGLGHFFVFKSSKHPLNIFCSIAPSYIWSSMEDRMNKR